MNNEIWKPVMGYEGFYEVSNIGRVRSINRIDKMGRLRKGRILSYHKNNKGYPVVNLWMFNKYKTDVVHRLVAKAFIPNPENKPCVNHIDETRDNNNVKNLEWVTYQENLTIGTVQKRMRQTRFERKIGFKAIEQIDLNGDIVREFSSMGEANRLFGYDTGQICRCCKGINKTHKGYKWRYKDNG